MSHVYLLSTPGPDAAPLRRAIAQKRQELFKAIQRYTASLLALYATAGAEARQIIIHYAGVNGTVELGRIKALFHDLQTVLHALRKNEERDVHAAVSEAATHGIDGFKKPAEAAGLAAVVAAAKLATVHAETVDQIINEALADRLNLAGRFWNITATTEQKVRAKILEAIATGQSAEAAAQALIREGAPLTKEVLRQMGYSQAAKIGDSIFEMFTQKGVENVTYRSLVVMRTEMTRAYRTAFHKTAARSGVVVGMKWNLSAAHPAPDICDDLASANPDGLGPGCYRSGGFPAYPAHPNCFCFDTPIFAWEVQNAA